jgi:hypothetical protein
MTEKIAECGNKTLKYQPKIPGNNSSTGIIYIALDRLILMKTKLEYIYECKIF